MRVGECRGSLLYDFGVRLFKRKFLWFSVDLSVNFNLFMSR